VIPYLVLGKIGCPKTSVRDHQSTLRNILKERRSQEGLTFELFLCLYLFSKCRLHRTMKTVSLNSLHIALSFLFHLSCKILYHNCGESLDTLSWWQFFFPSAALRSSYWLLKKDSLSWREWVLLIRSRRSFRHSVLI
jgi:hypothetical protein